MGDHGPEVNRCTVRQRDIGPEAVDAAPRFDAAGDPGKGEPMSGSDRPRIARLGRRVGLLVFAFLVAGITAAWTLQIVRQVWFPVAGEPVADCRSGVLALLSSVQRARAAASEASGEGAALERFRRTLLPEWNTREALVSACQGDRKAEQALFHLDALRYAEEHAVRYEAVSLAEQRRQTDAIARELSGVPRQ